MFFATLFWREPDLQIYNRAQCYHHKITIYRRESLAELCHTLHCACSNSWQVSCESFMRKNEEIDRKNRIFGRKTDILRKCVARCAILLNIYGKKDCFDVSSYNWAHKHHFIVRKTKKTYLSDCENSHEKQQTGIFCKLKTCFYLPISG